MKLKVLMSLPLDHFSEVVFLLGPSETVSEHLRSRENLSANPRLKLKVASIAFDFLFSSCRYYRLLSSVNGF